MKLYCDILCNTEVITSIVKLVIHTPVGKFFFLGVVVVVGRGGGLILHCCEHIDWNID